MQAFKRTVWYFLKIWNRVTKWYNNNTPSERNTQVNSKYISTQNLVNKFLSSIIYTIIKGKTGMFINSCVDKNIGIFTQWYIYSAITKRNEYWYAITLMETWKHCAKWKKPVTKDHTLCGLQLYIEDNFWGSKNSIWLKWIIKYFQLYTWKLWRKKTLNVKNVEKYNGSYVTW